MNGEMLVKSDKDNSRDLSSVSSDQEFVMHISFAMWNFLSIL